jgi:serine phosphatase RsbU (regulator of sigma subunit)
MPSILLWPSFCRVTPKLATKVYKQIYKLRSIQLFILALVLTICTLGLILYFIRRNQAESAVLQASSTAIIRLSEKVMYYDEVLTMSCKMYATSGNPKWEVRYNDCVPQLDSALLELKKLAPNAFELGFIKQTDVANQALIALETSAFEQAKTGKLPEALAILEGKEYEKHKQIYSTGMMALKQQLQANVATVYADHDRKITWLVVGIAGILPIILLAFVTTLGLIKKYIVDKARLEEEITRKNQALAESNLTLERRVEERTFQISEANKELNHKATQLSEQNHELQALEEELRQNMEEMAAIQDQLRSQFEVLSLKDKNISDSINYAKRIQTALLPRLADIQACLPASFVFFRPRDVVSGDFYWFAQKKGLEIVIVADCTGHGVPGAFMSIIALESLNYLIHTTEFASPDHILSDLNIYIHAKLKQAFSHVRDGMDMAVCVIDRQKQQMEYAGAKIPLYIIQEKAGTKCLQEVKATRKSIGDMRDNRVFSFHKHVFDLAHPTTFYLSTDGYQDQFGGERNYKLMSTHFKQLLFDISQSPMPDQQLALENHIKDWLGQNRQIDDMLVVGVKV